jgi:hypothetical protein
MKRSGTRRSILIDETEDLFVEFTGHASGAGITEPDGAVSALM